MKEVCVVIPIYKENPSRKEYVAIENILNNFLNYDIAYVGPRKEIVMKYPRNQHGNEEKNREKKRKTFILRGMHKKRTVWKRLYGFTN